MLRERRLWRWIGNRRLSGRRRSPPGIDTTRCPAQNYRAIPLAQPTPTCCAASEEIIIQRTDMSPPVEQAGYPCKTTPLIPYPADYRPPANGCLRTVSYSTSSYVIWQTVELCPSGLHRCVIHSNTHQALHESSTVAEEFFLNQVRLENQG